MKKIIAIFLTIISMFSFFVLFTNEKMIQKDKMEKAEQNLSYNYKILIPNEISNRPQEEIYLKIKEVLNKYDANIYYNRIDRSDNDKTQYVYINNTDYFSNFKLTEGRFFEKEDMETNNFLSSDNIGNNNQIGKIATFAGRNSFKIATLKDMLDKEYLFDGYCSITLKNKSEIKPFIALLEKNLNVNKIQLIPQSTISGNLAKNDILIILSMYFIIMLLILYDLLKSYKKIGIEKLLGYSNKTIYTTRIVSLLKMQIVIVAACSILMSLIMFKEYNIYLFDFIYKLLKIYFVETIILIIICSIPFIYINKISINNMLKNKQPTKEIMMFNFFIKTAFLVIFIILINQGITNFNRIKNVFTNSFQQWDEVQNYVVIPHLYNVTDEFVSNDNFNKEQENLYKIFNANGSILASFQEYLPSVREIRLGETKYDYERDNIKVNPNYLKKYPIYDENGQRILISEDEKDYILLIPNKYKSKESDIKKLHEFWKSNRVGKLKDEKIKIIWTKLNQKLFSMLIEINPDKGNYVVDPIVQVITEKNGSDSDFDTILGINANPFKIKVENSSSPEDSVRPILKQFGYDKYVKEISSANEQIANESKTVKDMIGMLVLSISFITICILIIIIQNIFNFFEQYKQRIVVRQLNGYKNIDKYKEYFIILTINWILIIMCTMIIGKVKFNFLLEISLICIIFELIITFILLIFINKRKVNAVLKGED